MANGASVALNRVGDAEWRRTWHRVRFDDPALETEFREAVRSARRGHVVLEIAVLALIVIAVAPIDYLENAHWHVTLFLRFCVLIPIKALALRIAWRARTDLDLDLASALSFCCGIATMVPVGLLGDPAYLVRSFSVLGAIILMHTAFSGQRILGASLTLGAAMSIFGAACFVVDQGSPAGMVAYAGFVALFSLVALGIRWQIVERAVRALFLRHRMQATAHAELSLLAGELDRLTKTDPLTGVGNRRHLQLFLDEAWRAGLDRGDWVGLVLCDVDHFKIFNDRAGHPAGDECLRRIAVCLDETLAGADVTVTRFGGEEFAVVVSGRSPEALLELGEAARTAVAAMVLPHPGRPDGSAQVSISVGVSGFVPSPAAIQSDLMRAADDALYEAKRLGRNRVAARAVLPSHWTASQDSVPERVNAAASAAPAR